MVYPLSRDTSRKLTEPLEYGTVRVPVFPYRRASEDVLTAGYVLRVGPRIDIRESACDAARRWPALAKSILYHGRGVVASRPFGDTGQRRSV